MARPDRAAGEWGKQKLWPLQLIRLSMLLMHLLKLLQKQEADLAISGHIRIAGASEVVDYSTIFRESSSSFLTVKPGLVAPWQWVLTPFSWPVSFKFPHYFTYRYQSLMSRPTKRLICFELSFYRYGYCWLEAFWSPRTYTTAWTSCSCCRGIQKQGSLIFS